MSLWNATHGGENKYQFGVATAGKWAHISIARPMRVCINPTEGRLIMAKQRMKRTFDATARVFTFDIDGGKAVITFDLSKFTPAQIDFYVGRGINQLDGDAVSGDTGEGNSAKHIGDILTARRDVVYSGVIPSGRGPSIPRGGLSADVYGDLVEALAMVKDYKVTEAEAKLQAQLAKVAVDGDDKATRKAQRELVAKFTAHAAVKKIMAATAEKRAKEFAKTVAKMADDNAPLEL